MVLTEKRKVELRRKAAISANADAPLDCEEAMYWLELVTSYVHFTHGGAAAGVMTFSPAEQAAMLRALLGNDDIDDTDSDSVVQFKQA